MFYATHSTVIHVHQKQPNPDKKKITKNLSASLLFAKIFILACSPIALELAKPKQNQNKKAANRQTKSLPPPNP